MHSEVLVHSLSWKSRCRAHVPPSTRDSRSTSDARVTPWGSRSCMPLCCIMQDHPIAVAAHTVSSNRRCRYVTNSACTCIGFVPSCMRDKIAASNGDLGSCQAGWQHPGWRTLLCPHKSPCTRSVTDTRDPTGQHAVGVTLMNVQNSINHNADRCDSVKRR